MARKRYTAEEIISQLRTVEIETAKGIGIVDMTCPGQTGPV